MLYIKREEKRIHLNHGGFTLIELLVGISILAIIVVPLLNNFVTAAKVNAKARRMQNETLLAQNLLESIKGKPISVLAKEFNYPEDFGITGARYAEVKYNGSGYEEVDETERSSKKTLVTGEDGSTSYQYDFVEKLTEPYYFAMKDIAYGGRNYDALIRLDGTVYRGASYSKIFNNFSMPVIEQIDTTRNILAVQSNESELAVAELYKNHIAYCIEKHRDDEDPPAIPYSSKEEIKANLYKEMIVDIEKQEKKIRVKIDFIYTCPAVEGAGTDLYTLVDEVMEIANGKVYLFYFPSPTDRLRIIRTGFNVEDPVTEIYIVRQEATMVHNSEELLGHLPSGVELYTNGDFGIIKKDLVKKEEPKNRIFQVKVQLFPSGEDFHEDALCTEFITTKEE